MKNNKYRLYHNVYTNNNYELMTKSITSLSHSVKHNSNIRAYFPKFQKKLRGTPGNFSRHTSVPRRTGWEPLLYAMQHNLVTK